MQAGELMDPLRQAYKEGQIHVVWAPKSCALMKFLGSWVFNSSWKATYDNFELADFQLAASQEGPAAVGEFLVPATLPQ